MEKSSAPYVDTSIPARKVIEILSFLFSIHGRPLHLRSDNGPEFIALVLQQWLAEQGTATAYIEPGKPWQNGGGQGSGQIGACDYCGHAGGAERLAGRDGQDYHV